MSEMSPIETREIDDAALDAVAGGFKVGGSITNVEVEFVPGPNGIPVPTSASIGELSLSVSDLKITPGGVA